MKIVNVLYERDPPLFILDFNLYRSATITAENRVLWAEPYAGQFANES